ncbi:hypothetical protein FVE85_8829 [Porphyridium purpureum]|uniref:Uncharacterized protein n=1 Tax=Porphyridium purpureum TaxID=35688 RepID=A0A5J4YRN1_PORPP|nr:hypothetical protein FVE85_8829 [Porphyridium purpureum]|eukprot:POR6031..scf296_7
MELAAPTSCETRSAARATPLRDRSAQAVPTREAISPSRVAFSPSSAIARAHGALHALSPREVLKGFASTPISPPRGLTDCPRMNTPRASQPFPTAEMDESARRRESEHFNHMRREDTVQLGSSLPSEVFDTAPLMRRSQSQWMSSLSSEGEISHNHRRTCVHSRLSLGHGTPDITESGMPRKGNGLLARRTLRGPRQDSGSLDNLRLTSSVSFDTTSCSSSQQNCCDEEHLDTHVGSLWMRFKPRVVKSRLLKPDLFSIPEVDEEMGPE